MFIISGYKSPEIVTSRNPLVLFIEAKGSVSLIIAISWSLKLDPRGEIILRSFIMSVFCSSSDNFNRTVTSSSPFGNSDIMLPLIADLTCSPKPIIENPRDCPFSLNLRFFSWIPNSRLSLRDETPGIFRAIFINSLDASLRVFKSSPWNLTSRSLPGGPPLGALIVRLSRPGSFIIFFLQALMKSFVLISLLSAVFNSTTMEPSKSLPIELGVESLEKEVLVPIVDILNWIRSGEDKNSLAVLSKPTFKLSSILIVWVLVVPECILKLAITISASGVGKKLNKTLPPDIIPIEIINIPTTVMKVIYL